jgi:NADH-quinone oxidoreductase subunit B
MFNNYAIVQGVDHIVPVDMYLPGCPPRPEMLLDAILRLHEKIQHEPLGERRRAEQEAELAAGRGPAVRPGATPSSWRFDKHRKQQWAQAVAEGREEQLRISDWMQRRQQPKSAGGARR